MKRKIVFSTRFKKDYRKYQYQPKKLSALNEVLKMLENREPIPTAMFPHQLHGEYEGCMECHVGGNFLLIWIDETTDTVKLVRLGTHHELFGI